MEKTVAASPARTAWTVFLCMLVAIFEGYDLQVIGIAAPHIRRAMQLSPEQLGWAFSAGLIGLALGAVIGGWLADRVGRRPILAGSAAAFGAFTIASAYAPDFSTLFLLRFATGLGLGGAMPNMIALVSETAGRKHMTTAVAVMFCGAPLGGIMLSALARTEGVDWRHLFLVGGVLPLVIAPLLAIGLAETHRPGQARSGERVNAWRAWFGQGSAASTLLLWLVFALTLFQLSLVLGWLPTLVVDKGFAPRDGSMAQLLFNVGTILGAGAISFFCDRVGVRSTMVAVYAGMAVVIFMLSQAREIGPVLALSLAAGFFILGVQFALYGIAPKLYDEAIRGIGVGGAVGVGRIGAIVGPIVAGMLLGAGLSGDRLLQITAPVSLAAGLAFLLLTFTAADRLLNAPRTGAGAGSGAPVQESGGAG